MENQFLRQVARLYINNGDLDSVFVFPNRRSLKFFQKYLGVEYGLIYNKPLFAPNLITINDLYANLSGLKNSDSVKQLYILYKEYIALKYPKNKKQGEEKEPFDDFIHWGDTIIKDFNDIDKYLVNAKQLFTNIKNLKELDNDFSFLTQTQLEAVKTFWTNFLKGGKFSEKKEFFISIWELMYPLYTNFKAKLSSIGEGYEGQIYREVAENISKYEFSKTVVFIGFNAPNKCERALMSYLKKIGKGDFYWDFYGELLTQKENSASYLISEYAKEYPSKYKLEDSTIAPSAQNFEVFGAPSGVAQAFVVEKILEKLYPMDKISNEQSFSTAVILPDENLLMPVLNSIPQKFESINVTMGYPIAATAFISFMSLLQNLQNDVRERGGVDSFYHKSVIELLSHEYFKKLSAEESKKIKNEIISTNSIYISSESEILKSNSTLLNLVFKVVKSSAEIAEYQLNILEELDHKLEMWDREFIYQYYLRIQSLKALNIPMESKTYFKLINQLTMGITVPFKGEPLAGLQIMGTLETRCLDFENVIIISANEGKFPSSNVAQSLIPYNLRVGFQLPTYELQDGIAAYHFYRSICRAKNIFMVYDTRSEDLNNGEVSRYVKQLKYHFNIPVKEQSISPRIEFVKDQELCINKDKEVMDMLISRFTGEGKYNLSASAINNYIACPLKFYLENIEKLPDEDEVVESVESNTFGTIYHSVMENIYKQYVGKTVTKEILQKEIKNIKHIEEFIDKGFESELGIKDLRGQDLIVKELIKKYVNLTLKEDISYTPFVYIEGEKRIKYQLDIFNGNLKVNFKAFIDRIDKLVEGDTIRIIDYKTGTVVPPPKNFELEQLFDVEMEGKYKAILQLYLYAIMVFDKELREGKDINDPFLTIYPLKKISKEHLFILPVSMENLLKYKELLTKCVEEIFDKDIPFKPNPSDKHCSYCKLFAICKR